MTLRDKLFTVRDDQPYLNAVAINIPEFKALGMADESEDKQQCARELAYIYHMCDYHSPYHDIEDKQKEVAKAYMGTTSYKETKRVKNCIKIYKKMQYSSAHRSLESAMALAKSINTMANQSSEDSEQMAKMMKGIDREIKISGDIYTEMALTKEKLDLRKQSLDIAKISTDLISKIEKNIDSLLKLKQKVNQATYEANEAAGSLNKFLIDEFLDNEIA